MGAHLRVVVVLTDPTTPAAKVVTAPPLPHPHRFALHTQNLPTRRTTNLPREGVENLQPEVVGVVVTPFIFCHSYFVVVGACSSPVNPMRQFRDAKFARENKYLPVHLILKSQGIGAK